MRHFLADFRQFRQLTFEEDAIALDSVYWTKALVTSLQREYPDKIVEWIKMAPSQLLDILDGIAATKPAYRKAFHHAPHSLGNKGRQRSAKSLPHRSAVHSVGTPESSSSTAILECRRCTYSQFKGQVLFLFYVQ